jgi:hypothetical protein
MTKEEVTVYKGRFCEKHSDFIWGDYIDESVVEGLLRFWRNQTLLNTHEGRVYRHGDIVVDRDYKESLDLHIPFQLALPEIQNYMEALQGVLNKYVERFPFSETSRFQVTEPLSMQCYPPGGGFKQWHTERSNALPGNTFRHLVFMTYLNDAPGGGTEWFHQDKYVDATKGFTVIWPADWTHHHRGAVTEEYEKMIITGWFSFI